MESSVLDPMKCNKKSNFAYELCSRLHRNRGGDRSFRISSAVAVVFSFFTSNGAHGATIDLFFNGHVSQVAPFVRDKGLPEVNVGEVISGKFSFSTEATNPSGQGALVNYHFAPGSARLSVSIGSSIWVATDQTFASVRDNFSNPTFGINPYDAISISASSYSGEDFQNALAGNHIYLNFSDTSVSAVPVTP